MRASSLLLPILLAVACSSSTDGEDCPIVGTYAVTGASESGTCPDDINETTIYTVSQDGDGFAVEIQGVQGFCDAQKIGTCKVQGKCDVGSRDPGSSRGTLQFSWTFNRDGFKGTLAVSLPDAPNLPGGCTSTNVQTGVRR